MHLTSLFSLSTLLCLTSAHTFYAETGGLQLEKFVDPMPLDFDLAASQTIAGNSSASNSWWLSSFIYGSDGHQYMVLSHVLRSPAFDGYRATILDITDPSKFQSFTSLPAPTGHVSNTSFNATWEDFSFAQVTEDPLGRIRSWSTREGVEFDITFELSTPVIFDGGSSSFGWAGLEYEWSVPACLTSGSLVVDNKTVTIDPVRSLTWYDRQWGYGSLNLNWTWFELHLNDRAGGQGGGEKVSLWFAEYPLEEGNYSNVKSYQWATVRQVAGVQTVLPAETLVSFGETWTSSNTNITYAQNWNVTLVDGTELTMKSIRGDQEMTNDVNNFRTYEGFVEVTGRYGTGEPVTGYGLVEVQPISAA